ncbi:MAG: SPASM domain-containing protein [Candidatus Eremiobacteraeota bacterium]|nr:SPASM domain-containing protein [Candidatus Eremiobacteraeota bacterium]
MSISVIPQGKENVFIGKKPGSILARKGEKILVLVPETGAWDIIDSTKASFLARLEQPVLWSSLVLGKEPYEVKGLEALVQRLYHRGIVTLNGKGRSAGDHGIHRERQGFRWITIEFMKSGGAGSDHHILEKALAEKIIGASLGAPCHKKLHLHIHIDDLGKCFDEFRAFMAVIEEKARAHQREVHSTLSLEKLFEERHRDYLKDHSGEVCCSLRGSPAQWESALRFMGESRERGLTIVPRALTKNREESMSALAALVCEGYGAVIISADTRPGSHCSPDDDFSLCSVEMLRHAAQCGWEHRMPLVINELSHRVSRVVHRGAPAGSSPHPCFSVPCACGISALSFDCEGNIYSCGLQNMGSSSPVFLGHIDEVPDLSRFVEKNRVLAVLCSRNKELVPRCRRCEVRAFCGGGCARRTALAYDEVEREDPLCRTLKRFYEQVFWELDNNPLIEKILSNC